MKITDTELQGLKDARTENEWNAQCHLIKARRGGEYPSDWYQQVIQSGLLASKMLTLR